MSIFGIILIMRKFDRQNAIVAATVVLCFMVTLGLVHLFSGEGLLSLFDKQEGRTFYVIAKGGYKSRELALADAELIRSRGGAGYLYTGDGVEIYVSVYDNGEEANKVLENLGDGAAYVKEIAVSAGDFEWLKKENKDTVDNALSYFDLTFDGLVSIASGLNSSAITTEAANTQKDILYRRLEELKSDFYENTQGIELSQINEIKVALITANALVANINTAGNVAEYLSSVRYQSIQLVLLYAALMQNI